MSDQACSSVENNDGRIGCDHTSKQVSDLKQCALQGHTLYDKLCIDCHTILLFICI